MMLHSSHQPGSESEIKMAASGTYVPAEKEQNFGKRRRNEDEWQRNKRKKLKAEGQEYVTSRGKVVEARKTGLKCRCSKKCLDQFSADAKGTILQKFNELGDSKSQDIHLARGIQANDVQRRRSTNPNSNQQRSFQYKYSISTGTEVIQVCREAYASLHGIGSTRIRRISKACGSGLTPCDKRGYHNNRPRAISEELKMKIHSHIEQYPYEESHYGRSRTKKRYLNSELSIRKMYTMFIEKEFPEKYKEMKEKDCKVEDIDCPITYKFYFDYFKDNFNYGFGKPRTDVCGQCEELKVKIAAEKNKDIRKRLETQLNLHKKKADSFYCHLRESTDRAKQEEDRETLCFDFEQNLPFPHLPVGEVFYKRQLWFYNFSVHSCKTGKPVMYNWPECTARRGCNEVISCLHHYLRTKVPRAVKHLDLYCDGCRGQNHNNAMIRFLFTLVFNGVFESINLYFPIRGHSFLPCDREFGVIEREKRKKDTVEMYTEWHDMIGSKFESVDVKGGMIYDYKKYFTEAFKTSVVKNKEKFKVSEYKRFTFSADNKYHVVVSSTMKGTVLSEFALLKPNKRPSFPSMPLYTEMVAVKKAKLDDVKSLSKYLSQPTVDFINSIPEKLTRSNDDSYDED